jgi:hypothetical protein
MDRISTRMSDEMEEQYRTQIRAAWAEVESGSGGLEGRVRAFQRYCELLLQSSNYARARFERNSVSPPSARDQE